MDRQIVQVGAIPLDTDQLLQNKNTMVGLGYALQAILGTSTLVDGLACTPTSPAGMTVNVATGSIYSLANIDATTYGSLNADTTNSIVKQGIVVGTTNFSCPAPVTVGQSVVYLIEAAYQDVDGGSTVLNYYNSSNPAVPYSGPSNSGTAQYTVRQGKCVLQVKTGVAATTGTQTTPAADAGFTGLYAITVANGAVTITSGNIAQLSTAPFISTKLPNIISTVQTGASTYAVDSSVSANTITVALTPALTSYGEGQPIKVKVANTTTNSAPVMNVNALGNVAIYGTDRNALHAGALKANGVYSFVYDGSHFVLQSAAADTQYTSQDYAADTGSANAYVATIPEVVSLAAGIRVSVLIANTNTTSSTFNLNSLGAVTIKKISGTSLVNVAANDLPAGFIVDLQYDGTYWQTMRINALNGALLASNNLSDISNNVTALSNLFGSTPVIPSGATGTTQAATDSSTKLVTTALLGQRAGNGFINRFRNPGFDIAQRGVTGTTTSATGVYSVDGWIVGSDGTRTLTWNQVYGSIAGHSINFLNLQGAASTTDTFIKQRIRGLAASVLAGQRVTVQISISNSSGGSITPTLTVNYANSLDNFSAVTADVSAVTLQTVANSGVGTFAYTFTASGNHKNGMEIIFDFGASMGAGSSVYFWSPDIRLTPNVSVGLNSAPPTPEIRPLGAELPYNLCEYRKSYNMTVAAGATSTVGAFGGGVSYGSGSTYTYSAYVGFGIKMSAAPSLTTYSTNSGASGKVYDSNNAADVTPAITCIGAEGFVWQAQNSGSFAATGFLGHYTASCEL